MSAATKKSQKGFVAVTLITLLAIALVLVVYASLLGTFTGGVVNVVSLDGEIKYSRNNTAPASEWKTQLTDSDNVPAGESWYVLFNSTSGGYVGNVNITWALYNGGTPVHNETTTNYPLDGNVQTIYASSTGNQLGNYDWGQQTTTAGTYNIKVFVEEA